MLLESLDLSQYVDTFIHEEITIDSDLTDDDMKELGMKLGHRKTLKNYISTKFEKKPKSHSSTTVGTPTTADSATPTGAGEMPCNPGYSLLMVGSTGVGKSYIVEGLIGKKGMSGFELKSVTSKVQVFTTPNGNVVIDSPGLNDTQNRDLQILDLIGQRTKLGKVLPVIVISFHDVRFTDQIERCLEALSMILELECNDYILVINRMPPGKHPKEVMSLVGGVAKLVGVLPAKVIELEYGQAPLEKIFYGPHLKPVSNTKSFADIRTAASSDKSKREMIQKTIDYCNEKNRNFCTTFTKFPSFAGDMCSIILEDLTISPVTVPISLGCIALGLVAGVFEGACYIASKNATEEEKKFIEDEQIAHQIGGSNRQILRKSPEVK